MSAATANLVGITGITRRLVLDGVLSEADARKALDEATKAKKQAHLYLLENRLVSHAHVAAANSIEFGMPLFDAGAMDLRYSAVKLVNEELIQKHGALPLFRRGNKLYVAVADPTNTRALDDIKFATNMTVEPILVDEDRLRRRVAHASSPSAAPTPPTGSGTAATAATARAQSSTNAGTTGAGSAVL